MNNLEIYNLLEIIKSKTKEIKANPEVSRKLLINAGIYNTDGTLTDNYSI